MVRDREAQLGALEDMTHAVRNRKHGQKLWGARAGRCKKCRDMITIWNQDVAKDRELSQRWGAWS